MLSQPTGGGRRVKQQLKLQLLLVNFYLVLAQLQINRAHFSLVFPTQGPFCTQIVVLHFLVLSAANFSAHLEKLDHMRSSSLYPVFQVTNNR